MIRFGFYYLKGKMIVYDVTVEYLQGHRQFVATLSECPSLRFTAVRPETAVESLKDFLAFGKELPTLANVTWMPPRIESPTKHRMTS